MLTVYSKANCPQCDQAKSLLELKQVLFQEVRVDLDPVARQYLVDQGHRSVPQIYSHGELFVKGGYQGLKNLTEQQFQLLKETQHVN